MSTTSAAALKNVLSQNFSFPSPIIKYILDETSSKTLSKLYKTCKYFYSKKRLIIVDELLFLDSLYNIFINGNLHFFKPNNLNGSKLWATKRIYCDTNEINLLPEFLKSIKINGLQDLIIETLPPLKWKEFEFLAKNVTKLCVKNLKIVECDDQEPPLEEIILRAPHAKSLSISPCNVTPETSENLLKIQRNQKFSDIYLPQISEFMDSEKFFEFLEMHAAPKAYVYCGRVTIHFITTMKNKLLSWKPADEKPLFDWFL